jgi:uncharacterized protein DUF3597
VVKLNTKTSVVDYMKQNKLDSSYANRSKLATNYGIKNYTGTAQQNVALLGYLAKPKAPTAPPKTPTPIVAPPKTNVSAGGNVSANTGAKAPTVAPTPTNPTGSVTAPGTPGATAPGTAPTPATPTDFATQLQNKINAMYDAQQAQKLAEFANDKAKGIADLQGQQAQTNAEYQGQRNQADVVAMQNAQRMKEQMANSGLMGSGENITAQVGLQNARQGALSQLNLQEQGKTNEINKAIGDWNDPSKETAIKNDIASQRNQALYDAYIKGDEVKFRDEQAKLAKEQADRDYNRNVLESDRDFNFQKERAKMSDTQWQKEFDNNKYEFSAKMKQENDQFAKTYGLDLKKFMYDQKVTEREWAHMSPADKERMALQAKYSKSSGGGGGGGSSKKSSSSSKAPAKSASQKSAEAEFNKGVKSKGNPAPNTYDQYFGKMLRLEGGEAYDKTRDEQIKERDKAKSKKKK